MAGKYRYAAGVNHTYVYGSAVRAPEAPSLPERERRKQDAEVVRQARRKVEEKVAANRADYRSFSFKLILIFTVAAALMILAAAFYTVQLSANQKANREITSLEEKITSLKEDNALLNNQRENDIDLTEVYEFAVKSGMQIPEKQQIITYQKIGREYVTKDGEIPND